MKGAFKVHYVIGDGPNKIFTGEVTCYCDSCIADVTQTKCEGYTLHFLTKNTGQQMILWKTKEKKC